MEIQDVATDFYHFYFFDNHLVISLQDWSFFSHFRR